MDESLNSDAWNDSTDAEEFAAADEFDAAEFEDADELAASAANFEADDLEATADAAAVGTSDDAAAADESADAASNEYVGRWNRLVSRTNWDKGKIILAWRQALRDDGLPAAAYSDEAWSRRVGCVTPQHVGRLRRVYERFGETQRQFPRLFWSHFHAAIEWDDAEMWLEGAAQNGWSVSEVRRQRWEALGAPAAMKPRDEDIIQAEVDEDVGGAAESEAAETFSGRIDDVDAAESETAEAAAPWEEESAESGGADDPLAVAAAPRATLESFAALPPDLHDAFDACKVAIVNHKLGGWQAARCEDVLAALDALRAVALSASE